MKHDPVIYVASVLVLWLLLGAAAPEIGDRGWFWLLAALAIAAFHLAFRSTIWTRKVPEATKFESSRTTPAVPAPPEPKTESELQPAPEGALKKEGSIVMTSPSNHPLAGKTGAFLGIVGFILDVAMATLLYYVLAGWLPPPSGGVPVLGLAYPIEVAAIVAAYVYYRIAALLSVTRERSPRWAWIDLIGTIAVAVVLVGAAASFHPVVAAFYAKMDVPTVPYNTFTMAVLVSFGIAVLTYARKYHLRRAEVGLDSVQAGEVDRSNVPAAVPGKHVDETAIVGDEETGSGSVVTGRAVVIHGEVHNLIVADPTQVVRVWPKVVAGRELKTA